MTLRRYALACGATALALVACAPRVRELPAPIPPIRGEERTAFALRYIDVAPGSGALAEARKCFFAHYTGWLTNGTKFDSSRDTMPNGQPRTPISFPQGARRVISGWDTGFEGMRVGGRRRLLIPYQLAYGERGRPPVIPPRAELIFDVELMAVTDTLPRTESPNVPPAGGQAQAGPRCPAWAQDTSSPRSQRPPSLTDGWQTASADSLGVDPARLAALTQSIRAWPELGVHAILIERSGRLIYEEYFDGFDERWGSGSVGRRAITRDSLHDLRSVTKSVVSALVGVAVRDGVIRSLDQPVIEWFPDYPELNTAERRRVTLRHVIGMTSGLEWNEDIPYNDPRNDEIRMTRDSQPLRYALSRPFAHDPGTEFTYNGGLTHVMGAVVSRATKLSLQDYARTKLFEPLGITEFEWLGDLAGMPAAASGLRLRPRDLAKFGSLYLHGGSWNGKQILPADWTTESTRRHFRFRPRTGPDANGQFGYSYFWWYNCYPAAGGLVEARTAVGNGQQRVFVLPGLDMVVTILAGRYNDFTSGSTLGSRILREHVIPAVRTNVRSGCSGS